MAVPSPAWSGAACLEANLGRQRSFWSTQPDACGESVLCESSCVIPGLTYVDSEDGRTISNDDWLRGLLLNILSTRARSDQKCPSPSAVYGHWSESYRQDGLHIGSRIYDTAERSYRRTNDSVNAICTMVKADAAKLVAMGLATAVDAVCTYRGGSVVDVIITLSASSGGRKTINFAGALSPGGWEWR